MWIKNLLVIPLELYNFYIFNISVYHHKTKFYQNIATTSSSQLINDFNYFNDNFRKIKIAHNTSFSDKIRFKSYQN